MTNDDLARELADIGRANHRLLNRQIALNTRLGKVQAEMVDVTAALETNRQRQCELLSEAVRRARDNGQVSGEVASLGIEPKDGGGE